MKSVLISIQPKWCELIASGKKTIEVRKTRPKLETPFKCYIYETKPNRKQSYYNIYHENTIGKVIGEFVCDSIDTIAVYNEQLYAVEHYQKGILQQSCLTIEELKAYLGVKNEGYAWHSSDLEIYDTPKELGEFKTPPCEKSEKYCEDCKYKHHDYDGEIYCKDDNRSIKFPPQSWCYVEALCQ